MSDKKKIDEGFVPPKPGYVSPNPPVRGPLIDPNNSGEAGVVPPLPPVKVPSEQNEKK